MDYGRLSLRGLLRGYSDGGSESDRGNDWDAWNRAAPLPKDRPEGIHMIDRLKGKKTYISAAAAIIGAFAGWVSGELSVTEFIIAAWAAAQTIFIRAGIAKAE